jgi:hypothetical protein
LRVVAVTMKNWLPEAPARLGLGLGHRHDARRCSVVLGGGLDHVYPGRRARAERVAALDDEAAHDAVEGQAVVEPALDEVGERGASSGARPWPGGCRSSPQLVCRSTS